ncbi:DNA-directed RNA polymerases I, II, and III subunit RPABC1 [Tritrichomonas foetus]|uniref:DNA-directed RNA polymerases I, II, and III subunit RPABC1 n=1 Tax=Tritrichomonas foetus TaxID=1144522 RepID=A0A1J4J5X4_9EUKA|nr:DNA-directed RNA polymerases I, II, and III subunit RPABC1 [Tritrichomonas foetus]|eukprot:OHS94630.1 DNA-directed RNA polymerases I, II, and III subunit RPABC1 [Tritrichomonas foetus]
MGKNFPFSDIFLRSYLEIVLHGLHKYILTFLCGCKTRPFKRILTFSILYENRALVKYQFSLIRMGDTADEKILNRFFRMNRTVLQMLRDRKYILDQEKLDLLEADCDTFCAQYDDNFQPSVLNDVYESSDPEIPRLKVRFDITESANFTKFNQKVFSELISQMKNENISHEILIVKDGSMTSGLMKTIEKLRQEGKYRVEVFEQKEVLINITEHELVPLHEPLSSSQKKELLDRYKINESQLPKILKNDPVVRYFGVDPGTVMKITRRSETAGRYVTYRLVC